MKVTIWGYKQDGVRLSRKTVEIEQPTTYGWRFVHDVRRRAKSKAGYVTANCIEFVSPLNGETYRVDAMNKMESVNR